MSERRYPCPECAGAGVLSRDGQTRCCSTCLGRGSVEAWIWRELRQELEEEAE